MSDSTQLPGKSRISPWGIPFASTLVDLSEFLSFLAPPRILLKEYRTAGTLPSTGVTPLRATTDPSAIPPPSAHFPLGYRTYLAAPDFARGQEGLLQLLGDALLPCCGLHPAQVSPLVGWPESERCCLCLLSTGSALRFVNNEATFAFTTVAARKLAYPASRGFVDGLRGLGLPQDETAEDETGSVLCDGTSMKGLGPPGRDLRRASGSGSGR
jgi:hypothetical protein